MPDEILENNEEDKSFQEGLKLFKRLLQIKWEHDQAWIQHVQHEYYCDYYGGFDGMGCG